jgi:hypothetical protein
MHEVGRVGMKRWRAQGLAEEEGQWQVLEQGGQGALLADDWSTDDLCWIPPGIEHQLCHTLLHQ